MKIPVTMFLIFAVVALGCADSNMYNYAWGRAIGWFANMVLFMVVAIIAALYDTRKSKD